jgi:N-acetylglucosamine malate deacetylase 1
MKKVLAIGAHPDDIEFMMSGTLVLLEQAGYEIHYLNIADGCCGTVSHSKAKIIEIRRGESEKAASFINAVYHESFAADAEIFYTKELIEKTAAVVRDVNPEIMLIPSLEDYMEDHQNAARISVTAAFCKAMKNFKTDPDRKPATGEVVLYHAQPYRNRDMMGRLIIPNIFVDISSVINKKTKMLSFHASQKDWLDKSQGINSYLDDMKNICCEIGSISKKYKIAEGWRKHSHIGYCLDTARPLENALEGNCFF